MANAPANGDGAQTRAWMPHEEDKNMYFAFISRHTPTPEQIALADAQGIQLLHVGDTDAFNVGAWFVDDASIANNVQFEGVVVVHPAAAMRLCGNFLVGVFENGSRAGLDNKPQFYAKAFHVYDMRS